MISFSLIIYILVSAVTGIGVLNYFYSKQQTTAAFLSLIFLILIFTFYGLRWFEGGQVKGANKSNTAWPPIVNMCPDYMTAVKGTHTVSGEGSAIKSGIYCVDTKNMYGNLPDMVDVTPSNSSEMIKGYWIKNDNNTAGFTNLKQDVSSSSDTARWPLLWILQNQLARLVTQGDSRYLRWEGVWDGRAATAQRAPLP